MDSDFLCERRLRILNPRYHELVKNTNFVLCHTLEKYKNYFPDFTDHTVLHSLQVINFCNQLIGDTVNELNEDELFVLLMSAYLHDSGMGISEADYRTLYDRVVSPEYRLSHPHDNIHETIRSFHQTFSKQFILKYASLFEIPSPEHVLAVSVVSEAHRKSDLYDEKTLPSVLIMPNGNKVHLPYLAALLRLADELDIAADRNIGIDESNHDTIFKMMHRSVLHVHPGEDRFVLDVRSDDPALYTDILREIGKLRQTLNLCVDVVEKRTPFRIRQKEIVVNRIAENTFHLTLFDTDLGTDDACALFLLKVLGLSPDYLIATHGNTTAEGACRNAVLLKKRLGFSAKLVRGLAPPENAAAEKGSFHGPDGLAGHREEMLRSLCPSEEELSDILPFEALLEILRSADSFTYVSVGPLTNLAAVLREPSLCKKLRGVYVMGGGINEFNCSHNTEFNFSRDPESVSVLLHSKLNTTLFPLDITNRQQITGAEIDSLEKLGTFPEFIAFLRHNLQSNLKYNRIPAAVLHDTLPVIFLAHPEWFVMTDMRINSDEYGRTYLSPDAEAIHVCTSVKENAVYELIKQAFLQER